MTGIDDAALDVLFRDARTHFAWQDRPVEEAVLRAAWDLARMGPTSANSLPARIVFVASAEAKAKLKPALIPTNVDKTMAAPVTAIVAYDTQFYEHLPRNFPHNPAAITVFKGDGKEELARVTAVRNGTLQGAYLIIAARALGLDCGAMSGFNNALVDQAFFPDGRYKSNFLCNIGYGDHSKLFNRSPRLAFEEACTLM